MRIVLPVALLMFVLQGAIIAADEPAPLVVQFPADRPIGMFRVGVFSGNSEDRWQSAEPFYETARGLVEVPPGQSISLHFSPWEVSRDRREPLSDLLDGVPHQVRYVDFALLDGIPDSALSGLHVDGAYVLGPDIRSLRRFANLKALLLDQCCLEPAAMKTLGELRTLEHLLIRPAQSARGIRATGDNLAAINSLTSLRRLDLWGPGITGEGLEELKDLSHLAWLRLSGSRMDPDSLRHLWQFRSLQMLEAEGFVTDDALRYIGDSTGLNALNLSGSPLYGTGLGRLKHLLGLRVLRLSACEITNEGLETLPPLGIVHLDLSRTQIGVKGIRALRKLRWLGRLDLSGVPIDDACLEELSTRDKLRDLRLAHVRTITSQGVLQLVRLKNLRELDLRGASVTAEAIQLLLQALPQCSILFPGLEPRRVPPYTIAEPFHPLRGLGEGFDP
jgi:hypothetical protein